MDLQHLWGLPDPQDNGPLPAPRALGPSRHPLILLRRALRLNIAYGIVVAVCMLWLLFTVKGWPLVIIFGVVTAFCLWALVDTTLLLRGLDHDVSTDRAAIPELRRQHDAFMHWMRTQDRVGRFIYPISAAGGGFYGLSVGAGQPVVALLHHTSLVVGVLIISLALTPVCIWLARWMFRQAFGKHVDRLHELILELEQ